VQHVRDSTPVSTGNAARSESFVPETPGANVEGTAAPFDSETPGSPEGKRKRVAEDEVDFAPLKPTEEFPMANGAKNPFAKKAAVSNPFAKPAATRALDSIKSTSFFDRVDNIEASGVSKAAARSKPKKTESKASGKQTTLLGMQKMAPPKPVLSHHDSLASTETESEFDETGDGLAGVLQESQVPETLVDEEEMQVPEAAVDEEMQEPETLVDEMEQD